MIRTAGVYGLVGSAVKGGSFPERILARARAGQPLRVVDDQRLNPTSARDLAAGTLALVETGATGLVHLVADGCCSWRELAAEKDWGREAIVGNFTEERLGAFRARTVSDNVEVVALSLEEIFLSLAGTAGGPS